MSFGASYVKISKHLFGCAAARDRGTCDNRLDIRIEVLEQTILGALKERLMAPEPFKEFCAEFYDELNRHRSEKNAELEAQHTGLARIERRTRRLLAVSTAHEPLIHPNLADTIRSLIEGIRLVPERGELRIELAGDLAGILALAADSKKPVSRGDGLQVTLVAGMRNHLYRTRVAHVG